MKRAHEDRRPLPGKDLRRLLVTARNEAGRLVSGRHELRLFAMVLQPTGQILQYLPCTDFQDVRTARRRTLSKLRGDLRAGTTSAAALVELAGTRKRHATIKLLRPGLAGHLVTAIR